MTHKIPMPVPSWPIMIENRDIHWQKLGLRSTSVCPAGSLSINVLTEACVVIIGRKPNKTVDFCIEKGCKSLQKGLTLAAD